MSQAIHTYRNRSNGKLGAMTEEQAAIWPDLLELVTDDAPHEAPVSEPVPDAPISAPEATDPTTETKD